jgi:hypothetical protein
MKLDLTHIEIDLRRIKRNDNQFIEPFSFWFSMSKSKQFKGYSFYVSKDEGRRILKRISKNEIAKIELKKKDKLIIYLK